MEPRTIEGTWEEVARHAPELAGHRVRLTVLDVPNSPVMLDVTLAELIEEAERLAASRGSVPDDSIERFRGAFRDEPAFAEVVEYGRAIRKGDLPV